MPELRTPDNPDRDELGTDERRRGSSRIAAYSPSEPYRGDDIAATRASSRRSSRPPPRDRVDSRDDAFDKPPGASRKAFFSVVLSVLIVFLLILFFGWLPRHARSKETERRAAQQTDEAPEIEVSRVAHAQAGPGLVLPGTTTALTEAAVYARANGYLKKRFVDIGDRVRQGQVLAIIDAPDLDQQVDQARQQLSQAEAQLTQQRTQLALTKITNDRYSALVAEGVFSRQEGDQREADYRAQLANVNAADRNVSAFQANLRRVVALQGYERITAPFAGVITERNVDTGALISASGSAGGSSGSAGQGGSSSQQLGASNSSGSTGNGSSLAAPASGGGQGGPLFAIAQADRLRILVSVPEHYADGIRIGQPATIQFPEMPGTPVFGTVTRTAGTIDQNTRTLLTEVQVSNAGGHLLAGMYAVVTFAAPRGPGALLISADAIAIRKDQPTVAVISDGKVKLTPIVIGRDYGATVEVVSGLTDGDLIASTFTDDVQEGAKVRIRENKQAAERANPPAPATTPIPPGGSIR